MSHPGRLHRSKTLSTLHGPSGSARVDRVLAIDPRSQAILIALHKKARTTPSVRAEIAATAPASLSRRMSANDEKILAYFKTVLDRRSWKPLTHAIIGQGAGIPLGSVGLAIRRVIAVGAVREGKKGSYRLA